MGLPPHTPPSGRPLDRVLPLNPPPGDFGPTPVAPARGEAGGMACTVFDAAAVLFFRISQRRVVIRSHRISEHTLCLSVTLGGMPPLPTPNELVTLLSHFVDGQQQATVDKIFAISPDQPFNCRRLRPPRQPTLLFSPQKLFAQIPTLTCHTTL